MSRNRCESKCECGEQLWLQDVITRPLTFSEYLDILGRPEYLERYEIQYGDMTVGMAICPKCKTLYCAWLSRKTGVYPFDTSYWETFNDEPKYEGD